MRAFARVNSIDRHVVASPRATLGIVTAGKAHYDFMEVLRRLDITPETLARARRAHLQARPDLPDRADPHAASSCAGLREVLVIEEKGPVVEEQLRSMFYNAPERPVIVGKQDAQGRPAGVRRWASCGPRA